MGFLARACLSCGLIVLSIPLAAAQAPGSSQRGIVRPGQPQRGDRPVPPSGADHRLPRIRMELDRDRDRRNHDGGDHQGRRPGGHSDRRGHHGHDHHRGGVRYPPLVFPYDYRYPYGGFGFTYDSFGGRYAVPPLGGRWQSAPWYPQSVLLDSRVVSNPPLPPVEVQLENTIGRDLQIAVIDLQDSSVIRSARLGPGESTAVTLARDSGAYRVSRYRTFDAWGYPNVKEAVFPIPPEIRYEVVVHEWAVQSVAIDRTGKSPDPIEDINMQGRGIGRFPLPPGSDLQSGTIDVYAMAKAAGNAGAVAPLVPDDRIPGSQNATPLERAILDAQRRAQSNRRP